MFTLSFSLWHILQILPVSNWHHIQMFSLYSWGSKRLRWSSWGDGTSALGGRTAGRSRRWRHPGRPHLRSERWSLGSLAGRGHQKLGVGEGVERWIKKDPETWNGSALLQELKVTQVSFCFSFWKNLFVGALNHQFPWVSAVLAPAQDLVKVDILKHFMFVTLQT